MGVFYCVLLLAFGVVGLNAVVYTPVTKLTSDIPTCSESDADLNECIRAAFQEITPRLKAGLKALNIPPLDPFVLDKFTYEYSSGFAQGRISLRNVRIYGLGDSIVDKVEFNNQDGHVTMSMLSHLPQLLIEGNYKGDVKLNDVRMSPKGYFNVSITDIKMSAQLEGDLYERDGHSYLRLTKFDHDPQVGDMKIYADGLFPDPALNSVLLQFINENWRPLYEALLPEARARWQPFMIRASNEFLAALPIDLLLKRD